MLIEIIIAAGGGGVGVRWCRGVGWRQRDAQQKGKASLYLNWKRQKKTGGIIGED